MINTLDNLFDRFFYLLELLLINASRAQLVREMIRPALATGEIVVCDRFYDSTTAYQAYGRNLDPHWVETIIDYAVGDTRPNLTFFLHLPIALSEERRRLRQAAGAAQRDRMEEADRSFFERVEQGYHAIAAAEPNRVKWIDATQKIETIHRQIWQEVQRLGT